MKTILSLRKVTGALTLAVLIFLTSCKKDNNNNSSNPDPAMTAEAVQNEANASAQFEDVFNITMGVQSSDVGEDIGLGTTSGVGNRNMNTDNTTDVRCFTVSVSPQVLHQFPKTVTIDFGSGCKGHDGKVRSGQIVAVFSGPMIIPGSKTTVTFVNYKVDSFAVAGSLTVQNTSSSNKTSWTVGVTDGKISNTQNGAWILWNGSRVYTQTEGNGTPLYPLDDVWEITGNSSGSNSNANSWTTLVMQPVVKKATCAWFVQGQVKISRNAASGILDFGDGSCDNMATILVNGKSYPITLP